MKKKGDSGKDLSPTIKLHFQAVGRSKDLVLISVAFLVPRVIKPLVLSRAAHVVESSINESPHPTSRGQGRRFCCILLDLFVGREPIPFDHRHVLIHKESDDIVDDD